MPQLTAVNQNHISPTPSIWATTLIVVALSLFMGLIGWIGHVEMASHASASPPWWNILAHSFLPWLPWLLVAPGIGHLALRYRIGLGHVWSRITIHMIIGTVMACAVMALMNYVDPIVHGWIGDPYFIMSGVVLPDGQSPIMVGKNGVFDAGDIPPEVREWMMQSLQDPGRKLGDSAQIDLDMPLIAPMLSQLLHYSIFIMFINGLLFYRDLQSREASKIRLEAELVRTQLQTLRGQLHPHFLFNTLSSIKTLMASDVDTAGKVLNRLADLLRASLRDLQENEVTLEQELAFIKDYLEIEQIRFGPDLKIVFDIDSGTEHASVPIFCLQPLVENAIKHGVGRRASLGEVRISAHRRADTLCIEVADDGPGMPADMEPPMSGIGLHNTKTRIEHLYGSRGSMDIETPSGGGFIVRLNLPFHEANRRTPEPGTDE